MKTISACVGMILAAAMSVPTVAGVLSGTVTDDKGQALHGVLVRLTDSNSGISEAVYTNKSGAYQLDTRLAGELGLRLRTPYYRDVSNSVTLTSTSRQNKDMVMTAMTDPMEISNSLPAAYHFGDLPFEKGENTEFSRLQFQRDCLSCHQLGNTFSRLQRTPESWAQTIARMHLYLGNFDMRLRDERSEILAKGFDGKPTMARPQFPVDAELDTAKITSYRLLKGGVPHDAIYNPDDGLLYTVDQMLDHMAITDPATGETEYVVQLGGAAMSFHQGITEDNPVHGEFNPGARHGPHSLSQGLDGKYYVTNTGTRSIGVFNPKTRLWEASHLMAKETGAVYPHTIRTDKKGIIWFSITGSEQVGRLDPETGKFTILTVPTHQPMGISGTTQVYGIDVNPVDGSIWYGRLFGDLIGRIDSDSFEITEYPSPVSGPRRMHFDKRGVLWVTGYSTGQLARIETQGFKSKVYDMPEFAPGYRPAPYALGVHPETQDIWVNENMTDRIFRFIPAQERWVVYPVPLRGTYTRDMTFTADGRICTSNNPLPAAALEGSVLEILCLDAEYRPGHGGKMVQR
jgi:streptogramin lyase